MRNKSLFLYASLTLIYNLIHTYLFNRNKIELEALTHVIQLANYTNIFISNVVSFTVRESQ